jgi:transposase-like protein
VTYWWENWQVRMLRARKIAASKNMLLRLQLERQEFRFCKEVRRDRERGKKVQVFFRDGGIDSTTTNDVLPLL